MTDRRLSISKGCSIENAQIQIDRVRIQCVHGRANQRRKLRVRWFIGSKFMGSYDQVISQVPQNIPRSDWVCVNQGIARNCTSAQHHVKIFELNSQIDLDVAQRFATNERCKGKSQSKQLKSKTLLYACRAKNIRLNRLRGRQTITIGDTNCQV